MAKEVTSKNIRNIVLLYVLIMTLANAIGAFLPADFGIPSTENKSLIIWNAYINSHTILVRIIYIINYIIPIASCFVYIHPKDKSKLPARLINMPYRYAGIGCLGWLVFVVVDTILVRIVGRNLDIKYSTIFIDDLMHAVMMSFFCFTLTYFTLETIHRNFVLPEFFPEGKLNRFNVTHRANLSMKVRNFYISVSVCPLLFIFSRYLSLMHNQAKIIDVQTIIVLAIFVVLGIILLCLTTRYISIPLEKMEEAIKELKNDNLDHRIDFVSNDDFGDLTDVFNDMTVALKDKNQRLTEIQNSIIKGMALMVESRDVNTGGHINRTSDCVQVFVQKLRNHPDYDFLPASFFDNIIKAAPMHDLGKIAVDDAVLRKPGKFEPEEYEMMKTHSAAGAKIVQQVLQNVEDEEFKKIAVNVAHYHHEKWNGEGYPAGLKGNDIPLEARIMALADVFDALVSKRCYKDSFTYDKAFSIIDESLGSHFDPYLGIQFLACRKDLEALYQSYN